MTDMDRLHPKVREAQDLMASGRMNRREFVRVAALLGVGAGAAYAMAGLPAPAYAMGGEMPFPDDDANAQQGGVLRVGMQIQKMDDPATFSWVEMSNQARHIVEYLSMTGPDNVTRPMLAESWSANDDLTEWTFTLRQGVMFHNGEELTAEIVKWNFERWMNPELAAGGILGLSTISGMMEADGDSQRMIDGSFEVVDTYTFKLTLNKPVLSVPEDLYNYPTAIVHSSFTAPFSDSPIGTGPFTLSELAVGDRCILTRVTEMTNGEPFEYWGGTVYLDEIHYYNFDEDNQLVAMAGGDVDAIYEFGIEQMEFAKSLPGNIIAARTAQTLCCRMQVTQAPFDNADLRRAVNLAIDNATVKSLVFPEGGDIGENHHVAPVHPDYPALEPLVRDVDAAKAALADAGYPDGVELTIDVGNTDGPWHQTACEAMRAQLQDAGITLNINVMPASKYWEVWDKTPFGATAWTHRPLGTMVMSLGYRTGVPWNEAQFSDPAFDAALDAAEATLDTAERTEKLGEAAQILQDANVMNLSIWRPVYTITAEKVNGYPAHPTQYHQYNKVWLSA
ncbi:MAG: ABC transporter substrate-binding protein [Pseudomonadota bacterium]